MTGEKNALYQKVYKLFALILHPTYLRRSGLHRTEADRCVFACYTPKKEKERKNVKRCFVEQPAQKTSRKFGGGIPADSRENSVENYERILNEKPSKTGPFHQTAKQRYIFFDMAVIPDRYYSHYEKCVNMKPGIDPDRGQNGACRAGI